MGSNIGILIGDAKGVDLLVQQYLYEHYYSEVHVFCINEPRNNVGSWPLHITKTHKTRLTKDDYMKKDALMAQEAKYGFMIWDGKSAGTVNNVLNLAFENKKCLVYCEWIKKYETVSNSQDIRDLIENVPEKALDHINNKILLFERLDELKERFIANHEHMEVKENQLSLFSE